MLTLMKGIGPITANRLIRRFGGLDNIFELSDKDILNYIESLSVENKIIELFLEQRNNKELKRRAEGIIEECCKKEIKILDAEDGSYPKRFHELPDIPVVLYTKGLYDINNYANSIGIIGARRCSQEGKQKAVIVAEESSRKRYAVISGMAKGIDSYAHTAAIKASGYTIAVLGNGVDICYPKEHQKLYEKIIKTGCVLSEYPPGYVAGKYTFPRRNRIIAALSDELCVIDAGRKSGTESTIDAAIRYGRQVHLCTCT